MQQGFIKRQQQPPAAPSGSRLEKREAMLLKHHPSFSDELLALRNARDTFISLLPLAVMGMAVGFLAKQLLADPNNECRNVTVMVIGDGGAGKSSLLRRYVTNTYTNEALPTEVFTRYIIVAGQLAKLVLVDSDSGVQRRRLMDFAHVCIVVTDKTTFPSAGGLLQSIPEAVHRFGVKVLCCTKCDDPGLLAPTEAAERVAQKHGALLVQVSAKSGEGVSELFASSLGRLYAQYAEAAAKISIRTYDARPSSGCALS